MSNNFVRAIAKIFSRSKKRKPRTHNYTKLIKGEDYFFEPIERGMRGYMTAQGLGIQPGDWIVLSKDERTYRYQVEAIDYYANPSDMWIALLKKEFDN